MNPSNVHVTDPTRTAFHAPSAMASAKMKHFFMIFFFQKSVSMLFYKHELAVNQGHLREVWHPFLLPGRRGPDRDSQGQFLPLVQMRRDWHLQEDGHDQADQVRRENEDAQGLTGDMCYDKVLSRRALKMKCNITFTFDSIEEAVKFMGSVPKQSSATNVKRGAVRMAGRPKTFKVLPYVGNHNGRTARQVLDRFTATRDATEILQMHADRLAGMSYPDIDAKHGLRPSGHGQHSNRILNYMLPILIQRGLIRQPLSVIRRPRREKRLARMIQATA
jgi:hypothetical protein